MGNVTLLMKLLVFDMWNIFNLFQLIQSFNKTFGNTRVVINGFQ